MQIEIKQKEVYSPTFKNIKESKLILRRLRPIDKNKASVL